MQWRFVLTDPSYVPVGEILNAYDRKVAKPISKLDTSSFRVRMDHPLAGDLMRCDGYIKAYRGERLMFYGPILTAEESVEDGNPSISVNAISAGWILQKRLTGKSATGRVFSTLTDRAQIVGTLIEESNNDEVPGASIGLVAYSGIRAVEDLASASAITYTAGPYKTIMEIINELGTAYDGFEWMIKPFDNYEDGDVFSPLIGQFVAAPRPFGFGETRPEAVFEWGVGRNNIKSYKRTVSRDTQANRQYHFTSSGPDALAYPTLSALDLDSIYDYKLLEELAQVDLVDPILRQQFLDESVRVRRYPRQIIEFAPHIDPGLTGHVPQFGTDYDIGDTIRARAVYGSRVSFDAWFRLWGMSFEINNLGVETGSMALVEEST